MQRFGRAVEQHGHLRARGGHRLGDVGNRRPAIEPLLLYLLARRDRTPLHASAFMLDGLAVVLAGSSGMGKSCLAHAAQRAGLRVLSDDTVHVQLTPALRVWGLPRPIHLLPADAPDGGPAALRWRNGKLKRAVPVASDRPLAADRAVLCLLKRGEAVKLDILDERPPHWPALEPGFDLLPAQSQAACVALTARGHARLTLGADPATAIAALQLHGAALARIAA
jgi:hypothetical protein